MKFLNPATGIAFTNTNVDLTLTGPAEATVEIAASSELKSWTPLITNQLSNGSLQFTDTLASNYVNRFYRAMLK